MRAFYWVIRFLLYVPFRLVFPVKVLGKENLPDKKAHILVSNHFSWKDIFIICVCVPGFRRIIGKKELKKSFIMRFLVRTVGIILIDRHNIDMSSMRICVKALKDNQSISIFPEGTRNKDNSGKIQEIKHGAAMMAIKGEVPIVPAILDRKPRIFRKTYLYIGDHVCFEEFIGTRLDSQKLAEAAQKVGASMGETKDKLDGYVQQKKAKKNKRKQQKP